MGRWDTIIVGGGTAGCVIASRVSEQPSHQTLLLEAGPDFGALDDGQWPDTLRAATYAETSGDYDWGLQARVNDAEVPYLQGRVIGGSSAINATGINWGLRGDYDAWAAQGLEGWDFDSLLPYFHRVENLQPSPGADPLRGSRGMLPVMRVAMPGDGWRQAMEAALEAEGLRAVDVAGPGAPLGFGNPSVNLRDGMRVTSAEAYLDPARARPNLTVRGASTVCRLLWEAGEVTGVQVLDPHGEVVTLRGGKVVVCAGAFGTPALLQRSGIGPEEALRPVLGESAPIHDLPGVGRNLQDHYGTRMFHRGGPPVADTQPGFQAISVRMRSRADLSAYDLNLFLVLSWQDGEPVIRSSIFNIQPESRGRVLIRGPDAATAPQIDTDFGRPGDIEALASGVEWLRKIVETKPLKGWFGEEFSPKLSITGKELRKWIGGDLCLFHHAVGTCKMGPPTDSLAVTDTRGRVKGFSNLLVADASVMPSIPRGMINLTVYAVAEKIAAGLTRRVE
jgi:choline dehydrogenase